VVPTERIHGWPGEVTVLSSSPDRLRLVVESPGGVLVVRRSYHPLYRAEAIGVGESLHTFPVNLVLLGVEVPKGRHEVELSISCWPEVLASAVALLTLAGALVVAWAQGTSNSSRWLWIWKRRAWKERRPGKGAENETVFPGETED
jgi:hypothetical protein